MDALVLYAAAALSTAAPGETTMLAPQAPAAVADPLLPARSGQLQCYTPDLARKTCRALARYTWDADGTVQNRAEVLLSQLPPIVMTSSSPVYAVGGSVCGLLRAEDIRAATFTVSGAAATPAVAADIRDQILASMAARLNREICTSYAPDQTGLRAEISIDAIPRPDFTETVIWVRPEDGYKVAP